MARFDALHRERLGAPYPARAARDFKLLRSLPAEYDTDMLLQLVERFFADRDPWVWEKVGPSIPVFVHRISILLRKPEAPSAQGSYATELDRLAERDLSLAKEQH